MSAIMQKNAFRSARRRAKPCIWGKNVLTLQGQAAPPGATSTPQMVFRCLREGIESLQNGTDDTDETDVFINPSRTHAHVYNNVRRYA